MIDENKDPELQTWIDPELEARVVAWVLGEASEFEAAELARIIAEKPELAIFKRRIEAVHGLVAAASRLEMDPMRLAPERREKLLEKLGAKKPEAAVVAMPQKVLKEKRPLWKNAAAIAACLAILALLASISLPSYQGVQSMGIRAQLANEEKQKALEAEQAKDDEQAAPQADVVSAPAATVPVDRLTALNALKALASQSRAGDEEDDSVVPNGPQQTYAETRSEQLWSLDRGWAPPVHSFSGHSQDASESTVARPDTNTITNKLNRIVIPRIEFRDATVAEALDFLKAKSVELDAQEPDPTRRGVNIVDEVSDQAMGAEAAAAPAAPAITGLPAASSPPATTNDSQPRITLSLSNIPLMEALKYVANLADLKIKVDPYAVAMVPPSVNTDELITKEYTVPPGFMPSAQAGESQSYTPLSASAGAGIQDEADATGAGAPMKPRQSAIDYLTANGVQFPPGANAVYFPKTGKLIVHNTESNLELVDATVQSAGPPPPSVPEMAGAAPVQQAGTNVQAQMGNYASRQMVPAAPALEAAPAALAAPATPGGDASFPGGLPPEAANAPAFAAAGSAAPSNAPTTPTAFYSVGGVVRGAGLAAPAPTADVESKFIGINQSGTADMNMAELMGQLRAVQPASFSDKAKDALAFNTIPDADQAQKATTNTVATLGDIQLLGEAYKSSARQSAPPPIPVQDEVSASDQPFSTFSLHVSDVSFLLAREELAQGQLPNPDSVRPEEFYNTFDYGDPAPGPGEQIACRIEQAAHPVFQQRNLVRIAMKVASAGRDAGQPLQLTVLLDTSGSMEREDRAGSVQRAMQVLTSLLGPNDAVTLIGFAREPRLLAEEVPGDQASKLVDIVKRTPPEGGTNMEEALKTATQLALRHYKIGGQNRVVMLTDGAANLGDADPEQLSQIVADLRQKGVSFDACGVGANGLNDDILEALTRKGGGRYYFLNQPEDADAGFAQELAGAFRPAAENVKMQVRFNPDRVGKYRLIGFDKNRLNQEDFRNDKVTAAQLASEEAAVALYQVQVLPEGDGELGEVFVRFRDPADGRTVEQSWTIPYDPQTPELDKASPSMRLAATASLLAEKLRGGPVADAVDLDALEPVVTRLRGEYAQQQRVQDLVNMFEQVRRTTAQK